MSLTNTATRYGTVAKTLHWAVALGILAMFPLGFLASNAAYDTAEQLATKATLFSIHKTLGVTILVLAVIRIAWAVTQPKPVALHPERRAETFMAELVHWLLYGSLVLVPLSGWIEHAATEGFAPILWPFGQSLPFVPKSPELAEVFATIHYVLQWVMLGSVGLHVAGAVKHAVIDRDATLRRMWFGRTDAGAHPARRHGIAAPTGALATWALAFGVAAASGLFSHDTSAAPGPAPLRPALAEVESDWQVTEGTLGISVQQFGKTVEGSFAYWTADIAFDDSEGTGQKGEVTVTVSIPSLSLGSVTKQALGPEYFDAEQFTTATFTAPIARTEDGYVADGVLTLRGTEVPVTLPFTLDLAEGTAQMEGTTTLDRRAFGMGETMTDPAQLGFDVQVSVNLTAARAGGS